MDISQIDGYYELHVQGTGGFSRLGSYRGTPEAIYEEMEDAMGADSIAGIGEFVAAIFRRDGERDVYFNSDGTWSLSDEVARKPRTEAGEDLMTALMRLRGEQD